MATSEIYKIEKDDKTDYLSDAESQENREYFTPGKSVGVSVNQVDSLEMNWPSNTDFIVKTGIPFIDNSGGRLFTRSFVIDRNVICDQVISEPVVNYTETRTLDDGSGAIDGSYLYTDTETQDNDGSKEKVVAYDRVKI